MSTLVLPTKFTAIDGMSGPVKTMAGNIHDAFSQASVGLARQERMFRRLTPSLTNATKQLISYGTAGLGIAAVGFSGKAIMDYETSIQSLQAVTGVTDKQLEGFKAEIVDTALKTKKSATDIAGSFEVIGSMMSQYLTDPKALNQISNAGITLAKASRQELVPTLENLTSIMNQFDIQAGKATDTVNRLTAGEIVGSLRTSQVSEALQEFGAGAYSANVNLAESVALVEALAKQMKVDKIGVGARNILTVLDSAKGLDKKARRDLRRSGVDLGYLMDRTKTLSERLHELSKISGNATTITSVFGKENKTAAQVIFNQLGTYDEYLAKIKVTNQATQQAATNSNTLAQRIDQLKNRWVNYIATGETANSGLKSLGRAIEYVTDNIDQIVSVGLTAIKVMALWKGAILVQSGVLAAYNVTVAASRVVSGAFFLVDMVKYIAVTQGMTVATAALSVAQAELNTIMMANPIGAVVLALAAIAGATYFAYQKQKELREEYQKSIALKHDETIKKESDAVEKLADHYKYLGFTIRQSRALAIRTEKVNIDLQRKTVEEQISKVQSRIKGNRINLPYATAYNDVVNAKNFEELAKLQSKAGGLATRGQSNAEKARTYLDSGIIQQGDLGSTFGTKKKQGGIGANSPVETSYFGSKNSDQSVMSDAGYRPSASDQVLMELVKVLNKMSGGQKVDVNITGLPAGASASSNSITPNSKPSY